MFLFFTRLGALVLISCLSNSVLHAQSIVPGDLVIVGYNFKDPDEFSILPLVELPPGMQFFITDCGWNVNASAFRPGEGLISYTVPAAGIQAGQQIHYPEDDGFITQGVNGFFGLSVAGDQLLIFHGSFSSPQFLFGLTDYNGGWLDASFTPTNQSSHLPSGLMEGQTALELDEYLQARFECGFPFSNRQEFLQRIGDSRQWIKEPDRVELPLAGCGFDILSRKRLEWNYRIEEDHLLLFVASSYSLSGIHWMYHTPEAPMPLACKEIHPGSYQCTLPERSMYFYIRPCVDHLHCNPYKKIDFQTVSITCHPAEAGNVRIEIPENVNPLRLSLHQANGHLVWSGSEVFEKVIHVQGLASGYFILTVELEQDMYQLPVVVIE